MNGFRLLLLAILREIFKWFVIRRSLGSHLEVERKFSISASEAESLPLRLREQGFEPMGSVIMTDTFLPPKKKGEMLRIRDEQTAGSTRSIFTMKRWVHTGEGQKERQESECFVSPFVRTICIMLGRYASSGHLLSFNKERATFSGILDHLEAVASIDKVSGLGKYSGFFLELECQIPVNADPAEARSEIFVFVEKLFGGPKEDVKRSYLEMLELSKQSK